MKKRSVIFLLSLALAALCLGPASAAAAEASPAPTELEADELPVHGKYTLYSAEYNGKQMKPSDLNLSSTLTLNEDGTGVLVMNGGEIVISKSETADGTITLYNSSGVPLECSIGNGIITLELDENYYLFYAHEGTGIAAGEDERALESLLNAFCRSLDADGGAHLRYEVQTGGLDAVSTHDVHAKGGVFYSARTTRVGGGEQVTATFYREGVVYVLYPKELRGSVATKTSSALIAGNVLMLDDLYQLVYTTARRGDYTAQTRELDGEFFTVEVFPATEFKAEAAFYFDAEGCLRHILQGAPKSAPELGESRYTVLSAGADADEALFDISAYKITE